MLTRMCARPRASHSPLCPRHGRPSPPSPSACRHAGARRCERRGLQGRNARQARLPAHRGGAPSWRRVAADRQPVKRRRRPNHPVMVTKIDNTSNSRPQVGLKKADLITEELVEGGSTRLAVFFYQHVPGLAGPVRSMRATDIGIVKPAKAVIVASGAAPPTVARIKAAGITAFTEGAPRLLARGQPPGAVQPVHAPPELAKKVETKDTVAELPAVRARRRTSPRGSQARGLDGDLLRRAHHHWTYPGGKYINQNSYAASGRPVPARQRAGAAGRRGDAGYLDPAGNPVPETKFTGTGEAMLFHGGRVVRGTWSKSLDSTVKLRTKAGALTVPAGHVWIELVPAERRQRGRQPREVRPARLGRARGRPGRAAARPTRPSAAGRRGCSRSPPRPRRRPGRVLGGRHRRAGGGHGAEEDPAERLAPCSARARSRRARSATMSWTMPKVVRSSCSR